MDAASSRHPSRQDLREYGLGKLDAAAAQVISKHLGQCADCRAQVAELSDDSFLGRIRGAREPDATMSEGDGTGGTDFAAGADPSGPPAPETLPPELLDHPDWEIIRELGRGGMGVVYLAQNRLMGRMEVLKVVGRHLIERPGVFERFRREIQSAARLQHTNIVAAYSAVRLESSLVLAMEYVDGLDLARIVKTKGPLPVAHASYFVHQVALGLQHAHERGMVHRDIKPANLILARDGKKSIVKVLDFGLAKVTSEDETDSNLTREGQMVGTPDFIAPEQIRDARSADIRADIYSLGCTLYYLLTGVPPFRRQHLFDVYTAHQSAVATPLNLVRPEVPIELAAVAAKMMAKEPGRRFQTPAQVAQALVPFFKTTGATAQKPAQEIASTAQPTRQSRPVETPTAPTQADPVEEVAAAPFAQASPRPQPAEPKWESLIEFKETEPLTEIAPRPVVIPKVPRRAQMWLAAAGAVVLLGVLGTWVAINNRAETPKGDHASSSPYPPPKRRPATDPVIDSLPKDTESGKFLTAPTGRIAPSQRSIENSIGMKLVLIPAGEFMMGSDETDPDAEDDEFLNSAAGSEGKKKHRVRITRAFYLGVHEVTQAQYAAVMGSSPSWFSATGGGKDKIVGQSTKRHPVENVSWLDAVKFCNKLSERYGMPRFYEIEGGKVRIPFLNRSGYRLPTEAEWEYACRANSQPPTRYSFGNEAARLGRYAWYVANSHGMPHPVGGKEPNGFGLFDMHGNVWEWCCDGYKDTYYKNASTDDPRGVDGAALRVVRGGSWLSLQGNARSANRSWITPGLHINYVGFRVARNGIQDATDPSGAGPQLSRLDAKYVEAGGMRDLDGNTVQRALGYQTSGALNVPGVPGALVRYYTRGAICWSPTTGAHLVYGFIGEKYKSMGGASSELGLPTSDELPAPDGRVSRFQGGSIYYRDGTIKVEYNNMY